MAQEFAINSTAIESKINQLLPSQGGFGAGVDFSASTMVIPIVDLTESAEGSNLRQDLQTCVDFATTNINVQNATNTVLVTTTGFFKVNIQSSGINSSSALNIFDGTTSKAIRGYNHGAEQTIVLDEFIVFLRAGDSLRATSATVNNIIQTFTRQIASITGDLTNPLGFV